MGILRLLTQKLVKYVDKFLKKDLENPVKTQEDLFLDIIRYNQTTDFGRKHNFDQISRVSDYQKYCKPQGFDYFEPYINNILEGNLNASFNAKLVCFGQTPGTAGKNKTIPIVQKSFSDASTAQARIFASYIAENPKENSRLIEGISCFFSAYPILKVVKINEKRFNIGYGTGVFSYPILYNFAHIWKLLLKSRMFVPIQLNVITDLEKKYRYLTEECTKRNITCFSGIPPIIVNYLEKIVEYSNAENIEQLFPNLQLLNFGGVNPIFYEKRIEDIVGHPVDYREMYAATEAIVGYQLGEEPLVLTPALDANFFEFVSLDDPQDVRTIADVKKNFKYKVLITTYNGFYRYNLGDIIEFISLDPPLFKFINRENAANVMDEKVTLDQVSAAIINTYNELDVIIRDFSMVSDKSKDRYVIVVEFKEEHKKEFYNKFIKIFDAHLCKSNTAYGYFRNNVKIIKPPELRVAKQNAFEEVEKERVINGQPRHQLKILQISDDRNILKEFENKIIEFVTFT
ncbi:MAG: hypothetical protein EU551_03085 [Promethearchaeota archaeon]|nr:MAG: hypothetical protein EU551_03085 [Candidatus Lokiarchaeota archaeon]